MCLGVNLEHPRHLNHLPLYPLLAGQDSGFFECHLPGILEPLRKETESIVLAEVALNVGSGLKNHNSKLVEMAVPSEEAHIEMLPQESQEYYMAGIGCVLTELDTEPEVENAGSDDKLGGFADTGIAAGVVAVATAAQLEIERNRGLQDCKSADIECIPAEDKVIADRFETACLHSLGC